MIPRVKTTRDSPHSNSSSTRQAIEALVRLLARRAAREWILADRSDPDLNKESSHE
jgi:hypothetical protein